MVSEIEGEKSHSFPVFFPNPPESASETLLGTLKNKTSASSTLNFGVQSLQFRSGVVDFELPVDAALLGVGLVGPDPNLGLEQRQCADASVGQTLTAQTT